MCAERNLCFEMILGEGLYVGKRSYPQLRSTRRFLCIFLFAIWGFALLIRSFDEDRVAWESAWCARSPGQRRNARWLLVNVKDQKTACHSLLWRDTLNSYLFWDISPGAAFSELNLAWRDWFIFSLPAPALLFSSLLVFSITRKCRINKWHCWFISLPPRYYFSNNICKSFVIRRFSHWSGTREWTVEVGFKKA